MAERSFAKEVQARKPGATHIPDKHPAYVRHPSAIAALMPGSVLEGEANNVTGSEANSVAYRTDGLLLVAGSSFWQPPMRMVITMSTAKARKRTRKKNITKKSTRSLTPVICVTWADCARPCPCPSGYT